MALDESFYRIQELLSTKLTEGNNAQGRLQQKRRDILAIINETRRQLAAAQEKTTDEKLKSRIEKSINSLNVTTEEEIAAATNGALNTLLMELRDDYDRFRSQITPTQTAATPEELALLDELKIRTTSLQRYSANDPELRRSISYTLDQILAGIDAKPDLVSRFFNQNSVELDGIEKHNHILYDKTNMKHISINDVKDRITSLKNYISTLDRMSRYAIETKLDTMLDSISLYERRPLGYSYYDYNADEIFLNRAEERLNVTYDERNKRHDNNLLESFLSESEPPLSDRLMLNHCRDRVASLRRYYFRFATKPKEIHTILESPQVKTLDTILHEINSSEGFSSESYAACRDYHNRAYIENEEVRLKIRYNRATGQHEPSGPFLPRQITEQIDQAITHVTTLIHDLTERINREGPANKDKLLSQLERLQEKILNHIDLDDFVDIYPEIEQIERSLSRGSGGRRRLRRSHKKRSYKKRTYKRRR